MSVRKHLAGFVIFSVILGSAILINHFLNIPDARIPPVLSTEAVAGKIKRRQQAPVNYRIHQISLDYNRGRSYTQLSLFRQPGQPVPEKVWVMTTFYSPDSARAESWTISTEIAQPFDNGEPFVATGNWQLPPLLDKPGAAYFARVYVSSESQGEFSEADYQSKDARADAIPVVIHWPDKKSGAATAAAPFQKYPR